MINEPIDGETVAIIGGTGKTGKWAVKAALQRGAKVRVLCRTPDKLKGVYASLWKDGSKIPQSLEYDQIVESGKLVVVKGSLPIGKKGEKITGSNDFAATDEQITALKELFDTSTYVMSFLGMDPKNMAPVCRPGIEAIMKASKECEAPPKILIMSSIVLSDSYAQGKAAWGFCCLGWCMRWKILKGCFDDMEAAEQYIFENRTTTGLDVSLLRATVLQDKKDYYMDYTPKNNPKYLPQYYVVKSDELKKVERYIDRQHVVECFMDAAANKDGKFSNCEWSVFDSVDEDPVW